MFEDIKKKIEENNGLTKMFLDYDGTLVNITSQPELAIPSKSLINLLNEGKKKIPLYLVTGRDIDGIISLVGHGFNVIAMHGSQFINEKGNIQQISNFGYFVERTNELSKKYSYLEKDFPGLRIIDKKGGFQFHYFNTPYNKIEALKEKISRIHEDGFEMYDGKFVYELRIKGVNKGKAIKKILNRGDFVLFAGDDNTDEEAFKILKSHITIKVGEGATVANFRLRSPFEMIGLISDILKDDRLINSGEK